MKLTPTLFPVDPNDEVLIHAEGTHGNLLIFCSPKCESHLHFQFNITGIKGAGIYQYNQFETNKSEAAMSCFADINRMIEMEVADERSGSTIQ